MNLKTSAALIGTLVLPLAVMAQNIATVNGKPVPKSRVDALIKNATHGQATDISPEMMAQAKDQVVMREIFAQEAEREGIAQSADYKAALDLARQSVLIGVMFQNYEKAHPISDEAAKAKYEEIKAANATNEVHAHHILVDSEDEAKKLIAQINAGAKFEDVAKKESKDTQSAVNGGDLDWARPNGPNGYVPEFAAALEKLKPGEMTQTPVKTQFGYHIIRLDAVRPAKFPTYDEVKDKLKAQMGQEELQEFQDKLRKQAKTDYKFAADSEPQQAPGQAPAQAPAPTGK